MLKGGHIKEGINWFSVGATLSCLREKPGKPLCFIGGDDASLTVIGFCFLDVKALPRFSLEKPRSEHWGSPGNLYRGFSQMKM